MTPIATIVSILCTFATVPLALIVVDLHRDRRIIPDPEPTGRHRAPLMGQPVRLPRRPEGRAALKAEIAATPALVPLLGELRLRPVKPQWHESDDWRFNTGEWRMAWDEWFADQPEDQAVVREWTGAGVRT